MHRKNHCTVLQVDTVQRSNNGSSTQIMHVCIAATAARYTVLGMDEVSYGADTNTTIATVDD